MKDLKVSKYNMYVEHNNSLYIYNQLSSSLLEVDKQLFETLKSKKDVNEIEEEDKILLFNNNFICDEALHEENILLRLNRIVRYGSKYARITIMPTLNCNFKCWYCYESHVESKMNNDIMQGTILFIENLVLKYKLDRVHLDWFGGEPLMFFHECMYPIAKEIIDFCNKKNIIFTQSITTNGYLIDPNIIEKMKEIQLTSFQITLDGNATFHNRTRFSQTDRQTYDRIVCNIETLCDKIDNVNMSLRINYTPRSLNSIDDIAYSFKLSVRDKIRICPQIVWQYKKEINEIGDRLNEKLNIFSKEGYNVSDVFLPSVNGVGCYVENMLQFVINYDGNVYKCTARDFKEHNSIGKLDDKGYFSPTAYYYKYFTSSYFENPECLACELLPSCSGMCLQKKIENGLGSCPKNAIYNSLSHQIRLNINSLSESVE